MSNLKTALVSGVEKNYLVKPKLSISDLCDVYEQAAGAVADKVMRISDGQSSSKVVTGIIGASVQGKCAECEEEEKNIPLMRKADGGGYKASPSLVSKLSSSEGGGSPLQSPTRNFMENAFSTDFSNVRVHNGGEAAEMSKRIRAKAFTQGSDIYFNNGAYQPETQEGKHLLAHELTHVVQQGNSEHRISKDDDVPAKGSDTQILFASERANGDFDHGNNSQDMTANRTPQASSCSINAIFLSTVAGPEKANCRVPEGKQGVSTLARFRLQGTNPGQNVTVSEQFAPIEDPYNIYSNLIPNSNQPTNGIFDDCYLIATNNGLPPDFRLKVLQNHLVEGNIISKNEILYTADGVRFCNHSRNRDDCGFSNRCK